MPIAVLAFALVASGCGSSKAKEQPGPAPDVLPRAATADQWARRVVDFLLRPLNRDLVVLQSFDSPQVRIYITTRNAQTLRIIHRRLGDLRRCSRKLVVIGPPPRGKAALARVHEHLRNACAAYEDVARNLLEATDLLSAGRADATGRGEQAARAARAPSARAAKELMAGIKIAQSLPPFRRAGLRPSV